MGCIPMVIKLKKYLKLINIDIKVALSKNQFNEYGLLEY